MALTVQNGSLVVRDGKLGTGQGCCCGGGGGSGPCNPSTCPNGTQCTPPCVCVDGQCVSGGACCLPSGGCQGGLSQEACEECVVWCRENGLRPQGELECPEGWDGLSGQDGGPCQRVTFTDTCAECRSKTRPPEVQEIGYSNFCLFQFGRCGTFQAGVSCSTEPCNQNPLP